MRFLSFACGSLVVALVACSVKTIETSAAPSATADGGVADGSTVTPCVGSDLVDFGTFTQAEDGASVSLAVTPDLIAIAHDHAVRVVALDGTLRGDATLDAMFFTTSLAASSSRIVAAAEQYYGPVTNGRQFLGIVATVIDAQGTVVHASKAMSDQEADVDGLTLAIQAHGPIVLAGASGFTVGFSMDDPATGAGEVAARWLDADGAVVDAKHTLLGGATGLVGNPSFALVGDSLVVASVPEEDDVSVSAYASSVGKALWTAELGKHPAQQFVRLLASDDQSALFVSSAAGGSAKSASVYAISASAEVSTAPAQTTNIAALVALGGGRYAAVLGSDLALLDPTGAITKKLPLPAGVATSDPPPVLAATASGGIVVAWRDAATNRVAAQTFCY